MFDIANKNVQQQGRKQVKERQFSMLDMIIFNMFIAIIYASFSGYTIFCEKYFRG